MTAFLTGAIVFGYWTAGMFFLRFWRKTRDRLFAFFTAAFWVMGIEQAALSVVHGGSRPEYFYMYALRLIAFALIIVAIVDKNRAR